MAKKKKRPALGHMDVTLRYPVHMDVNSANEIEVELGDPVVIHASTPKKGKK